MSERNPRQSEQNRDRVLGCMVGGAVGDALGYAVEFDSWPHIQAEYGPEGITRYDGKGIISDDTLSSIMTNPRPTQASII